MCVLVRVFFHLNLTFFIMCMFLLLEFNPYCSHHFGNFSQAKCNPSWGFKGHFSLEFNLCSNKCFWSFFKAICDLSWGLRGHFYLQVIIVAYKFFKYMYLKLKCRYVPRLINVVRSSYEPILLKVG
jgi:hypothetical protein